MSHLAWSLVALGLFTAAVLGTACGEGFVAGPSSSTAGGGGSGAASSSMGGTAGSGGTTGSSSGTGGAVTSSGTGGGGGTGPGCDPGDGACHVCLHSSCEPGYCQCQLSKCQGILDCVLSSCTGDAGCFAECTAASGAGAIIEAAQLIHCGAAACAADGCPFQLLSSCELCLLGSCSNQLGACYVDALCRESLVCLLKCETDPSPSDCVAGCYLDAGSSSSFNAVSGCATNQCSAVCGFMANPGT